MKEQNWQQNLKSKIKKLKESPVFALTLGAKELCHSNFWKWLIDKDKNFAKVFFGDEIDVAKINCVEREKEHMDLVVKMEKGNYVIENKLKSLPDKEQLEKYSEKLNKNKEKVFAKGKIVSVLEPTFDIPEGWEPLSYEDVLNGIEKMYLSATLTDYDKIVVEGYIESSKNMLDVVGESCSKIGNTMNCSNLGKLSEVKLDDVAKKLQADQFVHFLNDNIREKLEAMVNKNLWKVVIQPGFTRKDSLVDIRFKKEEDGNELSLGVQIQGVKFKRLISTTNVPQASKKEKAERIFKIYHSMGWLNDYDVSSKIMFDKQTKQKNDYCSYVTDKYTLVYQYFNIENYDFNVLKDEILSHLKFASDIIKHKNL